MSGTHDCPGGCGARVPRHLFACQPCWHRLPGRYRDNIRRSYRHRSRDHLAALGVAMDWYRANTE